MHRLRRFLDNWLKPTPGLYRLRGFLDVTARIEAHDINNGIVIRRYSVLPPDFLTYFEFFIQYKRIGD